MSRRIAEPGKVNVERAVPVVVIVVVAGPGHAVSVLMTERGHGHLGQSEQNG